MAYPAKLASLFFHILAVCQTGKISFTRCVIFFTTAEKCSQYYLPSIADIFFFSIDLLTATGRLIMNYAGGLSFLKTPE